MLEQVVEQVVRCSCDLGWATKNPHCLVHADPDLLVTEFDYDPDMREDEPPVDMHVIEWTRVV